LIQQAIGFLGAGNMAEALIRGLINTGYCTPEKITAMDINEIRLALISKSYGIKTVTLAAELLRNCSLIILAVKPQQVVPLLNELRPFWNPQKHILISIAAGIPTDLIEKNTGCALKVIRVMPNTSARIQSGAAGFCLGQFAGEGEALLTRRLFESVGAVVRVEEKMMDAVTALSGSGPAYIFYLCEIMIEAGQKMGIPLAEAEQLAIQTIWGAARMLKESGEKPANLRQAVTSQGGTTEAALNYLAAENFEKIFIHALLAARDRAIALQSATQKVES
jgi:pyrroline-5-carboxylate reductase